MFTQTTQRIRRRSRMASLVLGACVATSASAGSASVAHAQAEMRSIPVVIVTALIRDAFEGTTIRLNGYGSVNAPIVENDSVITLGPRLGGASRRFSILPARSGRSPHHYYVSDINLRRIAVDHANTAIRLSLFFEEDGVELKGLCRGGLGSGCVAGRDESTPDIQIDNFRIDVVLVPGAVNDSLSFSRATVRMHGEPQAGGVCRLGPDICNALTDYKNRIRQHIEDSIRTFVLQSGIQATLARMTRPLLDERGVGRVFFAQIRGNDLEVFYNR
jgi:hypothetical protein